MDVAFRALILCGVLFAFESFAADATTGQWSYYGGSKRFDRYSALSQVSADNVSQLRTVWTRPGLDATLLQRYPDLTPSNYLRGTPILIDGILYAPNAVGLVEAFDPATGKTVWVQQPFSDSLREAAGQSSRGVDYWRDGADRRIFSVRGEYLYALDATTGALKTSFGEGGRVSLVVRDVIIVGGNGGGKAGAGYGDGGPEREAMPEDVRGYDVRSGKLLWSFHLIPPPGDPLRKTWAKDSADYVGNMAAWAPLSGDESLGYVYVPLSAPTNSYYGGHRPGDNLFADSLVALDVRTGRRVWHFQMVHHDLWDYDNASPPTLGDITVDGRRIPAVMQPNKNGFLFVFNRITGKPVWPIVERKVPQSNVPGEVTSRTQPFPTKPPAFDRQGMTEEDLIDFTPALREQAKKILADYDYGPLFSPNTVVSGKPGDKKGLISVPSAWGSGNWNTGAFDPERGVYYAVSMTLPEANPLMQPTEPGATIAYEFAELGPDPHAPPPSSYGIGPQGLPLLKPPYGRITALDLNRGEKLWTVPNGDGPRHHPLLEPLHLPPLGTTGRPVPLLTRTLLFLGESSDALFGAAGIPGPTTFRAYDKVSGRVLWERRLPAGTTGGPISYEVGGRQFILVPVGGKDYGSGWIAMALPDPSQPAPVSLVTEGKDQYFQHCAMCHGVEMQGAQHAPALVGGNFRERWSGRTARNFYSRVISTMPFDNPGTLTEAQSLRIAVYCLSRNEAALDPDQIVAPHDLDHVRLEFGAAAAEAGQGAAPAQ
jgi:glucose dehydrogenase